MPKKPFSDWRTSIHYPPALPIVQKKDAIQSALRNHQVVMICGETGSGKSTQIPKMCLEVGRGVQGKIACTQPRRIAAVTIAHRIADEMGEAIGQTVGYKIRFEEKLSRHSAIKIMTDGILLAETQHDPYLRQYDTIIVDEAHERSVNIDFLLGILINLLKRRKDIRIIITSATLDTEKFIRAFRHAPIIEVSGRMYPVEVRYRPLDPELEEKGDLTYIDAAVDAVNDLLNEEPIGDILVFMPTERDIRECCEILKGRIYQGTQIMPLYARLSWSDQRKVFHTAKRKVIVATNIAETSLTIPGIRFVVDTGLSRVLRYNPRAGTTSLPILPISKSSANQRTGRCGRIENGICIRLFSEADYCTRPEFNTPEMLRSNLAGVILKMLSLNLPDIRVFPFIDRPTEKAIRDGFNLLYELGAIDRTKKLPQGSSSYELTSYGRMMSLLPIDPRVARMIIEGHRINCLHEIIVIASALSIQDPRERPAEKEKMADDVHLLLKNTQSDFLTMLNIWRHYGNTWETLQTQNKMRKFCRDHFLSYRRMIEWQDIYHQIVSVLQQDHEYRNDLASVPASNIKETSALSDMPIDDPRYTAIHQSILSGYLSHIAQKKDKKSFQAAKGKEVFIFPGSGLFQKSGKWIVAAEYVETSRLYARTVANIDPEWLEKLGGHLCKRTYMDPHWNREKGEVNAYMQVTLFGLVIVPRRLVSYGNIDPNVSEGIFVEALVDGEISQKLPFLSHNRTLIERIKGYEEKIRKRDLLVNREKQIEFYRVRLSGVTNVRALRKLIFQRGSDDFLRMTEKDLLARDVLPGNMQTNFPDSIQIGDVRLPVSYTFDPGSDRDGATLKVPINALSMMAYDVADSTIPGLKAARINGLLKTLPKSYRIQLHPMKEKAAIILAKHDQQEKNFFSSLSHVIKSEFGINIPLESWSSAKLDDHLRMRYEIVDEDGSPLSSSRDLHRLLGEVLHGKENAAFEAAKAKWEKDCVTPFDLEELPGRIPCEFHGQIKGYFYPAISDQGKSCALKLYRDPGEAASVHRKGMVRCYALQIQDRLITLRKTLLSSQTLMSSFRNIGREKERVHHLIDKVILNVFDVKARNSLEFSDSLMKDAHRFFPESQKLIKSIISVMSEYDATRQVIDNLAGMNKKSPALIGFLDHRRSDLDALLPPDFLMAFTDEDLCNLIRYIKAIKIRTERGCLNLEKDRVKAQAVFEFREAYDDLKKNLTSICSEGKRKAVSELYKMIEEYKVSVFAPEIRTIMPVSPKRLMEKTKEIMEMI